MFFTVMMRSRVTEVIKRSFNDLYDFIPQVPVKKVGQTSVHTTLALINLQVPSVSSLSKLIQASPSFKTELPQERAAGL